jgi:hypothetical protein
MDVLHALEYLEHVVADFTQLDGLGVGDSVLNNFFQTGFAVLENHLLGDHVVLPFVVVDIQELYYILTTGQLVEALDFSAEESSFFLRSFHSNTLASLLVHGLVDHAKAASA